MAFSESQRGNKFSLFFPLPPFQWTATGKAFSIAEGPGQAIAPLFFCKHPGMVSCYWARAELLIDLFSRQTTIKANKINYS